MTTPMVAIGWTFEFADYVAVGCVGPVIDTPAFAKLAVVSDPFSYLP
eukprot:SAG31_NODE_25215_length_466_cov_0.504087_1_plen_46_part_10